MEDEIKVEMITSTVDKVEDVEKVEVKKFWSEDSWNRIKRYLRSYNSQLKDDFYTFKNREDYVPFCCIDPFGGLGTNNTIRFNLLERDYNSGYYNPRPLQVQKYITQGKLGDRVLEFVKENKHLLYLTDIKVTQDSDLTKKEYFLNSYNNFISKPLNYNLGYNERYSYRSSVNVIANSSYMPLWTITNCTKKEGRNKDYLTNYFFCGEIRLENRANFQQISTKNFCPITPLYCIVIKKEYIDYVKACMMNNISVNPEVLELWIDKELDNPKSIHPFRAQFNKVIRYPFKKRKGIIKVFDSLKEELLNYPLPKKFKSIPEQKNWLSSKITDCIDLERKKFGIVINPEKIDDTIESIIKSAIPATSIRSLADNELYPF